MKMKLVSFVILCAFLLVPTLASAEVTGEGLNIFRGGGDITSRQLKSVVGEVVALFSVIIGGLALARFRRTGNGRTEAIVAVVVALIGIFLGGLHLVNYASYGIGTGNGVLGGIIAIVLGLIGMVLAWRALIRSRRTG